MGNGIGDDAVEPRLDTGLIFDRVQIGAGFEIDVVENVVHRSGIAGFASLCKRAIGLCDLARTLP
jgi:hypothetical protein